MVGAASELQAIADPVTIVGWDYLVTHTLATHFVIIISIVSVLRMIMTTRLIFSFFDMTLGPQKNQVVVYLLYVLGPNSHFL